MTSDHEFATIEEAWSVPTLSMPSSEQSVVQTLRHSSTHRDAETAVSKPRSIRVTLKDPHVLDYLKVYREEYRDEVIETLLRRAVVSMEGGSFDRWKPLVQEVKSTLKEGFSTLCGTSDPKRAFQTVLLWVWFAIAILLFYLIARGGAN